MINAVDDQHGDERNECKAAYQLRAPAMLSHCIEHLIDRQLGLKGLLILPCCIENVVTVQPVGEFLRDEISQEQSPSILGNILVDKSQAERLGASDPFDDTVAPLGPSGMRLNELNGRQHFAVTRGLEEACVGGVCVKDIHFLEFHSLPL